MTNKVNKITAAMAALALCVGANPSYAHEAYGGINLAFVEYSEDLLDDEAALDTIYGRLGAQLNENISIEGRAGFGVDDDIVQYGLIDIEIELDTLFGGYLRGGFPVSELLYPYAIIGYSRVEIDYSIPGFVGGSDDGSDVSFGFGLDVNFDQNIALNIEYMNWYDQDDIKIDGLSVGLVAKF